MVSEAICAMMSHDLDDDSTRSYLGPTELMAKDSFAAMPFLSYSLCNIAACGQKSWSDKIEDCHTVYRVCMRYLCIIHSVPEF